MDQTEQEMGSTCFTHAENRWTEFDEIEKCLDLKSRRHSDYRVSGDNLHCEFLPTIVAYELALIWTSPSNLS